MNTPEPSTLTPAQHRLMKALGDGVIVAKTPGGRFAVVHKPAFYAFTPAPTVATVRALEDQDLVSVVAPRSKVLKARPFFPFELVSTAAGRRKLLVPS